MATNELARTAASIEQTRIDLPISYDETVWAFETTLGCLEPNVYKSLIQRSAPWPEVEAAMTRVGGPSGLMIIGTFDQGAIASLAGTPMHCRLYIVGNPAIAAKIIAIDVRASFYVPFRVAIYAEPGSRTTSITFDRPSSFLGTLGRPELEPFGLMLDEKIDSVVASIRQRLATDLHAA
ncbi:MAG TPA: DUF302 domain-containing protein [Gemmatimonadaceae bacterium]